MAKPIYNAPIPPERCTPGGAAGPDAMDWALRAALAVLGLAAAWFGLVLVKPLPTGDAPKPTTIPSIIAIRNIPASIDERQARLGSLNRAGNIFATDRRNWPIVLASIPEQSDDLTPGRRHNAGQQPTVNTAAAAESGSIEITQDVSVAVQKRLDQLRLRGVFLINGNGAAMIGQKTNAMSEVYRVGDTFGDGEWRLEAIDAVRDRVFISRSGQNFALNLYDASGAPASRAEPRPAISATNAPGDVEIGFTSLDKVATELREAGLPRDQINELISLAQEQPQSDTEPVAPADVKPDAKPAAIPPAMPPGMVQLFKAMAEGSRDVVAPTPVTESGDAEKPAGDTADTDPEKK